jgi:hypothetical protein
VPGVPFAEAADYLCSRFILHLVEGGYQLVARIVVTIADRFPEGADGEGDRGGEDRHEDIAAGEVQRCRHDWRVAGDRQDLVGELAELASQQGSPVKSQGRSSHVTGSIGGGRHG